MLADGNGVNLGPVAETEVVATEEVIIEEIINTEDVKESGESAEIMITESSDIYDMEAVQSNPYFKWGLWVVLVIVVGFVVYRVIKKRK